MDQEAIHWKLVIMDPKNYVKLLWKNIAPQLHLKVFILNVSHKIQTEYLSNPEEVLRVEYDTPWLTPNLPPNNELCLTSASVVRRIFKKDYLAGDYD